MSSFLSSICTALGLPAGTLTGVAVTGPEAQQGSAAASATSVDRAAVIAGVVGAAVFFIGLGFAAYAYLRSSARKRRRLSYLATLTATPRASDDSGAPKQPGMEEYTLPEHPRAVGAAAPAARAGIPPLPPMHGRGRSGGGGGGADAVASPGGTVSARIRRGSLSVSFLIPFADISIDAGAPLLGRGSFGRVYRGRLGGSEPVAVKVLDCDGQPMDRAGFRAFVNEVTASFAMRHDNIVVCHGAAVDETPGAAR